MPGLANVTSDLQIKNPQANVVVDRDKASALGVTPQQVEDALYSAYGQRLVSPIYTSNNEYWVVLQVQNRFQSDPDMLSELYIHSSSGQLVPLSAVSKFTTGVGPLTVNHTGQLPSVTISFNLARGVALGQAVNEVQTLANSMLPISITTSFQGTAQAFQQSLTGLGILLVMAVLVIYIVLGILYESYIHPITILTGLPAAAFGGLVTLSLFHMQLDIYGFVGLIMLIGIVKKNAIMMVDFALELERKGNYTASESAYQGSHDSLPPDHDDHRLHDHGHAAHRHRLWRRRRRPPPARSLRGRRPDLRAIRHALSHAGLLHLHGCFPEVAEESRGAKPGSESGRATPTAALAVARPATQASRPKVAENSGAGRPCARTSGNDEAKTLSLQGGNDEAHRGWPILSPMNSGIAWAKAEHCTPLFDR